MCTYSLCQCLLLFLYFTLSCLYLPLINSSSWSVILHIFFFHLYLHRSFGICVRILSKLCAMYMFLFHYSYVLYLRNSANEVTLILLMATLGVKTPKMKNCLEQTVFTTVLDPQDYLDSVQSKIPTRLKWYWHILCISCVWTVLYKEYS